MKKMYIKPVTEDVELAATNGLLSVSGFADMPADMPQPGKLSMRGSVRVGLPGL